MAPKSSNQVSELLLNWGNGDRKAVDSGRDPDSGRFINVQTHDQLKYVLPLPLACCAASTATAAAAPITAAAALPAEGIS